MSQDQEPRLNPIRRLPMIATAIDEMLGMAEEQHGNLQQLARWKKDELSVSTSTKNLA